MVNAREFGKLAFCSVSENLKEIKKGE